MGGNKSGHGRNGPEANPVVQVLWPRGGSSSDLKKKKDEFEDCFEGRVSEA